MYTLQNDSTVSLVNYITSHSYNFSLNNFHIYNTALLTIVSMLYFISSGLLFYN